MSFRRGPVTSKPCAAVCSTPRNGTFASLLVERFGRSTMTKSSGDTSAWLFARAIPGVTDGMLSARLRELCARGADAPVRRQPPVRHQVRAEAGEDRGHSDDGSGADDHAQYGEESPSLVATDRVDGQFDAGGDLGPVHDSALNASIGSNCAARCAGRATAPPGTPWYAWGLRMTR